MSEEDDTYSSMFTALKHPIRRKILRVINQKPSTYTEILNQLGVDNGLLNYHLDNMKDLTTKDEKGRYHLSEFGRAAVGLTERVEETPRKRNILGMSPRAIGGVFLILIVALASVSALYFVQQRDYQSQLFAYQNQVTSLTERNSVLESELAPAREALEMMNLTRTFGVGFERAHISQVAAYTTLYARMLQNGTYVPVYVHVNERAQFFSQRANLTLRVTANLEAKKNITIVIYYTGLNEDASDSPVYEQICSLVARPDAYNEFNVNLVERGWYYIVSDTRVIDPESDYIIHVEMMLSDGNNFLPFVIRSWEFN